VTQLKTDCTHDVVEIKKGLEDLHALSNESVSTVSTVVLDLQRRLNEAQHRLAAKEKWLDQMHRATTQLGNGSISGLNKLLALQKNTCSSEHDGYAFETDLLELIAALEHTCTNLETAINHDVLTVPTATSSKGFAAKSTVGVMLNDLTIHNMVIGGPAYKCKMLEVGDEIIKVDGAEVSTDQFDDFQKALI